MTQVLIFGDSLVSGLKPSGCEVTEACHPGATTYQLTWDFPNLTTYLQEQSWDYVVILAGTNDLGNSPHDVITPVKAIIEWVKCIRAYGSKPIVCTLIHDGFNEQLEENLPPDDVTCVRGGN
jgi:lysophospholipase L1-like esterase